MFQFAKRWSAVASVASTKELKKRSWGRRRKNHHVRFGKSRLTRAALPFSALSIPPVNSTSFLDRARSGNVGKCLAVEKRITVLMSNVEPQHVKTRRAGGRKGCEEGLGLGLGLRLGLGLGLGLGDTWSKANLFQYVHVLSNKTRGIHG